jgi:hypothetical protein
VNSAAINMGAQVPVVTRVTFVGGGVVTGVKWNLNMVLICKKFIIMDNNNSAVDEIHTKNSKEWL